MPDVSSRPVVRAAHLDLKGLPPTPRRLLALPAVIAAAGYNAILVEWEDAFPWTVEPAMRGATAYTADTVRAFAARAEAVGLELIPLVQCLGHLETALAVRTDPDLREVPDRNDVLNVLSAGARPLVESLIDDVLALTPGVKRFHLGGDEAWTFATGAATCAYAQAHGKDALYLQHVGPILDKLAARRIRPLLWHDMMIHWSEPALRDLGARADLVVWGYEGHPDHVDHHFNTRYIERFAALGMPLWAAGSFKGADGMDSDRPHPETRLANARAWRELDGRFRFGGFIATGWSRYSTHRMQVEPLDAALDVLVRIGGLWRDGRDPGDAQALEILGSIGERSRHETCRAAASQVARLRQAAEREAAILDGLASLARIDPARRGSGVFATHRDKFADVLDQLDRAAADLEQSQAGLVDDRWLREYTAVRRMPLRAALQRFQSCAIA